MAWRSALRQRKYPKEFRISAPPWSSDLQAALKQMAELLPQAGPPRDSGEDARAGAGNRRFLADVGTGLWRLRQKMTQPGTGKPLEEMRRAYRHFESVWDALSNEGVVIHDHTNEDFDAGQSLKVLAFQPTQGLRRERVIETIKPTICVNDEIIQMGEVIVGTPEG
jgi:hypothetical protein